MSWIVFVMLNCMLYAVDATAALTVVSLDSGDPQLRTITKLAENVVNNSSSILPGYNLQVVGGEEWCGFPPAPGLDSFPVAGELWGARRKNLSTLVGIIGPTCSSSAVFLGSLLAREESWPINIHMAESHMLEDRKKYPKSFGIAGSLSKLYRACIELIRINNWTRVSVLYDESHLYHSSTLYEIDGSLRDNHAIVEHFVPSSNPLTYLPLNKIKKESRIIFLFLHEELARKVLCFAYLSNVTYPAYQFIIVTNGDFSALVNNSAKNFSCSSDDLANAMFGSVLVALDNQYTYSSNHSMWSGLQDCLDSLPSKLHRKTLYYLDALQSLILALNGSLPDLNGSNGSLSQVVTEKLFRLNFIGLSGPVQFNKSSGAVDRKVLIEQVYGNEYALIATYSQEDKLKMTKRKGVFLPSNIVEEEVIIPYSPSISLSLAYVMFFITIVVTVVIVISHILTCCHRHAKEVKASSWKVIQLAFLGSYLLAVSVIAHVILVGFFRVNVEIRCHLWHVAFGTLSVGFTLIEGTMCVLSYRLYRIFVAYKNPGKCLSNSALVFVIGLCIFVTASVTVTWVVLDPLQPILHLNSVTRSLETSLHKNGTVSGVTITETSFMYCISKVSSVIWFTLENILNFALSIITCVFVYLARKAPMKQFRVTRLIRLNYIVKGSGLLCAYVYGILTVNISQEAVLIRFVIYAVILNFINSVILVLLFFPPLYPVLLKLLVSRKTVDHSFLVRLKQ